MTPSPQVHAFFDPMSKTFSYVVHAAGDRHAAVIDSVLDFDPASGRTGTEAADRLIGFVSDHDLTVEWILETHVHADHISAAPYLKQRLGGRIGIGARIVEVQETFRSVFGLGRGLTADGGDFDHLFQDGEEFVIGAVSGRALFTPGHTPACTTFVIGDAAFVGDTLFMPDFGTARCDFPGGDARQLYRSIQKILALPDETRLFLCHDYAPGGRDYQHQTTVAEERAHNIHVGAGTSEDAFVRLRTARDAGLSMPSLIIPSVQLNMRAGKLPPAEDNGVQYLKVPLNAL